MSNLTVILDRYNWIRRTLLTGIPLNCNEIAGRLGITAKTAQRYINAMRRDGYRIEYDAKVRGYRVIK